MADLLVLPRPAKGLQNNAGFRRELEHTRLAEKERLASVPQREQVASTPESPLPKSSKNQAGKATKLSVQSARS